MEIFDPQHNPEHRHEGCEFRVDWYMPSRNPLEQAYQRIAPTNTDARPKSLSAVIVSVGHGKQLEFTLPHNLPLLYQLVVVTTSDDQKTRDVVIEWKTKMNSKLDLIISDRCYNGDRSVNKAAMLNDGIKASERPDWIIFTDANCFLSERLPSLMRDFVLNPGCFYYTGRHDINESNLDRWKGGKYFRYAPKVGDSPLPSGYFQLWNRRALAIRDKWPAVCSEQLGGAEGVDTNFVRQWDPSKVILLSEIPVMRIEHAKTFGQQLDPRRTSYRAATT